jgi:hypothetical protein
MISILLRLPLDCLETRLLLDMNEQQYALNLDNKLIPCSPLDREFAPHLLNFHNFWDLLEYRLSVVLESAIDHGAIQAIIATLAEEIDVLDRSGHPIDRSLCQIISGHFAGTAACLSSCNDPFFGHSLRLYNITEIIVGEFRSLYHRIESYFEQRISEGSTGQMEYSSRVQTNSQNMKVVARAQAERNRSAHRP